MDLTNLKLASYINQKQISTENIIADYIKNHDTSQMKAGVDYYNNDNDIKNRKIYYHDESGGKVEDNTKTNRRIPHGWHKLLVDQKVGYLVGNPINFSADKNEDYTTRLNELLGENFDDVINELVKNASNKGVEYLQPYIDELGNFDYMILPAEQVIIIYSMNNSKEVEAAIRYYDITVNGEPRKRAEFWTKNDVTYYVSNQEGEFHLDPLEEVNPASHFYYNNKGYGWGKVPIIPFKNNEEGYSDLKFYKELVDDYDLNRSDISNNLAELQQAILVLKNYEGTSLKEFMNDLRYYKAIKVDEDGGVDKLTVELPIDSVDSHLDRTEENIFLFGQGVNMKTDRFGNSPSGIALKFMYALLDLKCNILERKFRKAIKELLWFTTEYIRIKDKKTWDYKTVNVTFNKTLMMNDKEQADIAQTSKGVISDETIIANHPWVEDINKEIEGLKKKKTTLNLDDENFGDD